VPCISEVASFENADSASFSWHSPRCLISSFCDSYCCASQIGVNKAHVRTVFISMIPQWRSLKNLGNYSLCHRRREIKMRNNYCLFAVCPGPGHLFTIAFKRLVSYLHVKSLRIAIYFHDDLNWTPSSCRPHERPQQTYKIRPCYLRVRVKTLSRYTLPRWTAPFTCVLVYPCLSAKVRGRDKTLYCHLWPV